jgi:DNA-binding NarL/FixJ family response regulator
MATEPANAAPLVLLVEDSDHQHDHAGLLTRAGFRVVRLPTAEITAQLIQEVNPAILVAELNGSRSSDTLDLAPRLRGAISRSSPRSYGSASSIPVIVYGHSLSAPDIERAARGGAMWLQLEPADGVKLVAAIRGVLGAAGIGPQNK